MIDTDKYEGMTYDNQIATGIELEITVQDLLAEVKRLREKNEKLHSRCMHLENLLEEWQGAYE